MVSKSFYLKHDLFPQVNGIVITPGNYNCESFKFDCVHCSVENLSELLLWLNDFKNFAV